VNILEYLNANGILWEPMDFDIVDGKKKPPKYCINYMPKSTDFAELSSEVIEQRQKIVSAFDYIAIDTRDFFHIDVDTWDHKLFVEQCKNVCPYFERATKKLPHCFIKANHTVATKRVDTIYKGIEILCGQWSYCRADALLYNADQHLEPQAFWKLIKEDASAPFQEVKNQKPLVYTDVNIGDLLNHIDIEFCDAYDTWLRIGAALFNYGFEKSVFDAFSERSHKYSYTANCDLWFQFEKKPLGCIQFASIMYLLKLSDFKYFKETQAKLKLLIK